MNIFLTFQKDDELETFLKKPEILELERKHKLVKSRQDSLVIFNELSKQELSVVQALAKELGGKIIESRKYQTFS